MELKLRRKVYCSKCWGDKAVIDETGAEMVREYPTAVKTTAKEKAGFRIRSRSSSREKIIRKPSSTFSNSKNSKSKAPPVDVSNSSTRANLIKKISEKRNELKYDLKYTPQEWGADLFERCIKYSKENKKRKVLNELKSGLEEPDEAKRIQAIAICAQKYEILKVTLYSILDNY